MTKLKKQLKELKKEELHNIIFELLDEGCLSYVDLSQMYIYSLKIKEEKNNILKTGLAYSLVKYWEDKNFKESDFLKAKSAYNLLKSNVFHTANIEKDLKECVNKFNYSEDENGVANEVI